MTDEKVRDATDDRPLIESQGGVSVGDVAPKIDLDQVGDPAVRLLDDDRSALRGMSSSAKPPVDGAAAVGQAPGIRLEEPSRYRCD